MTWRSNFKTGALKPHPHVHCHRDHDDRDELREEDMSVMRSGELGGVAAGAARPAPPRAPIQSGTASHYAAGALIATSAVEADNRGDHNEAYTLYKVATEKLLEATKTDSDKTRAADMNLRISCYIDRMLEITSATGGGGSGRSGGGDRGVAAAAPALAPVAAPAPSVTQADVAALYALASREISQAEDCGRRGNIPAEKSLLSSGIEKLLAAIKSDADPARVRQQKLWVNALVDRLATISAFERRAALALAAAAPPGVPMAAVLAAPLPPTHVPIFPRVASMQGEDPIPTAPY